MERLVILTIFPCEALIFARSLALLPYRVNIFAVHYWKAQHLATGWDTRSYGEGIGRHLDF